MSKVTIYTVADRAGVAISTVSRVLNNSPDVSDATRERVLQAIEELRFRPDRVAKTLAQPQAQMIAVALPTFTTPFHNELLKGVRMVLRNYNLDLLLCDLGSKGRYQALMQFLERGTVDGLLLTGVRVDDRLQEELMALQAPVVILGDSCEAFDSIYWDDRLGAKNAVEHLIRQGHDRIGMIRTPTQSELQQRRLEGYKDAMREAGFAFDESLCAAGDTPKHSGFSEEAGYEAMRHLLTMHDPVTAVFASSDVQAIGAIKAIREVGKRVPEDIAVVGYDDIKTSSFIDLSSIDQNMQTIGTRATEWLMGRVEGKRTGAPERIKVTPRLQVRASSLFQRA